MATFQHDLKDTVTYADKQKLKCPNASSTLMSIVSPKYISFRHKTKLKIE